MPLNIRLPGQPDSDSYFEVRVVAKCGLHVVPIVDTNGIYGEENVRYTTIKKDHRFLLDIDGEGGDSLEVDLNVDMFGMGGGMGGGPGAPDLPDDFRGSVLRSIEIKSRRALALAVTF